MLNMFFSNIIINQNVINIRDAKDVEILVKNFINIMLKRERSVNEFKRQN